jgi:hypothetical protein
MTETSKERKRGQRGQSRPNLWTLITHAERAGMTSLTLTFRFREPTHDARDQGDVDLKDWMAKHDARKTKKD